MNARRCSYHPHVASCHIHATALTSKCIYCVHDSTRRSKLVSRSAALCYVYVSTEQTFDHVAAQETLRSSVYTDTIHSQKYVSTYLYSHTCTYVHKNDSCIAVSDTWASGKSIPVQGVSVESQLVWKSYAPTNSPWSRETSLLRNSITRATLTFAIPSKNRVSKINLWIKSRCFLRKMIGYFLRKAIKCDLYFKIDTIRIHVYVRLYNMF